jgi:hypothetical protein
MQKKLEERGVTWEGRLVDLQKAATNNGVPTSEVLQKIEEGWEWKPKGLFQVLSKRGFINNNE